MVNSEEQEYVEALAESWHQTYKKSATTLITLLCLHDNPLWAKELINELKQHKANIEIDEKSLHRVLRRLESQDLIQSVTEPGFRTGVKRKKYNLTATGEEFLALILRQYVNIPSSF